MRRTIRPKKFILRLGVLLSVLTVLAVGYPLARSNAGRLEPLLRAVGERLALFSALTDLPDRSLSLLERRFQGVEYREDEPAPSPSPSASASSAPPEPEPSSPASSSQAEAPPASPAPEPSRAEASSAREEPPALQAPDIPAQYRGPMLDEDFSGYGSSNYLKLSPSGYLRNYTDLDDGQVLKILETPPSFTVSDPSQPQVLIYHTHATEAFERYDSGFYDTRNNWRSTDNNMNMVAVGNALAASLQRNGINVLHDNTQHDYPSYNGAYDRSAETIASYLEKYPSIRILLDVHRDAIDRDGTLVRPVTEIAGKKAAQLMIIAPCDDGTMNIPDWRENLRFAAAIQTQADADFPRLMRPIFFCYRKYNLDKTPGSLLLEFGSHGNTLEQCVYTAQLVGESIAKAIQGLEES